MQHDRTYCGALCRPCSCHALNRKDERLRWPAECPIDMQKEYKLRQTFQAASGRNSPCEESFLRWYCPCQESLLRWKGLSVQVDVEVGLSLQEVKVGLSLQGVVLQMGLLMQGDVEVGLSLQGVVLQMEGTVNAR